MAAGKRKCRICGEWIEDNNDSVPFKKGYVHQKCFNIAMKVTVTEKKERTKKPVEKKPQKQKELKEGLSEEEYKEKTELCEYIRYLTKEDLSVATYKLIEDYKKKYKISYKEMKADLYWYFDMCGHEVEGDRVIGIVPLCHTEAQKHYKSIERTNASCQENLNKFPEMYKARVAVVSKERRTTVPSIDISAIGGDD